MKDLQLTYLPPEKNKIKYDSSPPEQSESNKHEFFIVELFHRIQLYVLNLYLHLISYLFGQAMHYYELSLDPDFENVRMERAHSYLILHTLM